MADQLEDFHNAFPYGLAAMDFLDRNALDMAGLDIPGCL